jgi:hypothetical protein
MLMYIVSLAFPWVDALLTVSAIWYCWNSNNCNIGSTCHLPEGVDGFDEAIQPITSTNGAEATSYFHLVFCSRWWYISKSC